MNVIDDMLSSYAEGAVRFESKTDFNPRPFSALQLNRRRPAVGDKAEVALTFAQMR
jgi:hypothetical protein